METSTPEPTRLDLYNSTGSPTPPALKRILPLRIVKRSDSDSYVPGANFDGHSQRTCSYDTDKSRGSLPEPPGGEGELTVPKIRGNRGSQVFGSFHDVDETPVPLGRDPYLQNGYARPANDNGIEQQILPPNLQYRRDNAGAQYQDSFRSRLSSKLRDRAFAKSSLGFSDRFALLNSPRSVHRKYCPFPGLIGDIIQRSRTTDSSLCRDFSPPVLYDKDEEASQDSLPFSLRRAQPNLLPGVLVVPDLCITPDARVVDGGYHNFWVAIEISTRVHEPEHDSGISSENATSRSERSSGSMSFGINDGGFLYDLQVDFESTSNSRVLEVIEHETFPSTFLAGSKALVLVNVELDVANFSRLRGHVRSQSDELMEDLENQLGSAQCEYLKANVVYRHSAFSSITGTRGRPGFKQGVSQIHTKIHTTFTAAISRYNAASPWSPPPVPTSNRLMGIVAAYWGMDAADSLLHTKFTPQKVTPRKATYLGCPGSTRRRDRGVVERASEPSMPVKMTAPTRSAPAPPCYFSSQGQQHAQDESRRANEAAGCDDEEIQDPSSKIWARIRRCSGLSTHRRRDTSTSTVASVAASVSLPFSGPFGTDRRASRRKKAAVQENRLSPLQRQRMAAMALNPNLIDRTSMNPADETMLRGRRKDPKGSGKGRGGSGRWGFGSWWA